MHGACIATYLCLYILINESRFEIGANVILFTPLRECEMRREDREMNWQQNWNNGMKIIVKYRLYRSEKRGIEKKKKKKKDRRVEKISNPLRDVCYLEEKADRIQQRQDVKGNDRLEKDE